MAIDSPVRFNTILREIEGANKQSLAVALRELEEAEFLKKIVIQQKPLHVEHVLTEKGKSLIPIFRQLEDVRSSQKLQL